MATEGTAVDIPADAPIDNAFDSGRVIERLGCKGETRVAFEALWSGRPLADNWKSPDGKGSIWRAAADLYRRIIWIGVRSNMQAEDLEKRIEALEATVQALEAAGALKYCGVWSPDNRYQRGNVVTEDGSMWHCNVEKTTVRPGGGDKAWTLCVKRGRDAKR